MKLDLKRMSPVSALLAMLAFVAAPLFAVTAFAADAHLYEMTENMRLVGGTVVHRKATSELIGLANRGTPLCPNALVPPGTNCTVNATASDNISLATGLGKFSGTVTVVVHGDNRTDSPEFVVAKGKFHGNMDFSPAIVNGIPLGTVVGKLVLHGFNGHVPFTGTFRLPFVLPFPDAALFDGLPLPLNPFPMKFYAFQVDASGDPICPTGDTLSCTRPLYLDDSFNPFPVGAEEYGLGYPTVRFDITF